MIIRVETCEYDSRWRKIEFDSGDHIYFDGNYRKIQSDVREMILEVFRLNGVDETEIRFFDDPELNDEDRQQHSWQNRIYFRKHQFSFSVLFFQDITVSDVKYFETYLKMTETEITDHLIRESSEEYARFKSIIGRGPSVGWYNFHGDSDEDKCTGEYYWNID